MRKSMNTRIKHAHMSIRICIENNRSGSECVPDQQTATRWRLLLQLDVSGYNSLPYLLILFLPTCSFLLRKMHLLNAAASLSPTDFPPRNQNSPLSFQKISVFPSFPHYSHFPKISLTAAPTTSPCSCPSEKQILWKSTTSQLLFVPSTSAAGLLSSLLALQKSFSLTSPSSLLLYHQPQNQPKTPPPPLSSLVPLPSARKPQPKAPSDHSLSLVLPQIFSLWSTASQENLYHGNGSSLPVQISLTPP